MAKRPAKLTVRIPNFINDPMEWRRVINRAIVDAQARHQVQYDDNDKLEVQICLYLRDRKLSILDVDNRVKQILDALQGCIGDKGKSGRLTRIIPDDNQVYRIIAEKRMAPKKDPDALSTIVIRRYDNHRGTARAPREFRKHANIEQT